MALEIGRRRNFNLAAVLFGLGRVVGETRQLLDVSIASGSLIKSPGWTEKKK